MNIFAFGKFVYIGGKLIEVSALLYVLSAPQNVKKIYYLALFCLRA